VKELIESALCAPSSMNGQPWRFVVVRSNEIKKRLVTLKDRYCPPEKQQFPAGFLEAAPVLIVVCVDRSQTYDRGVESGVLATGHLLLAAASRGLSAIFLSAYASGKPQVADGIRSILEIPAAFDPISIVPIGQPAEAPAAKPLRSFSEVTFYEAFGRK
jgi:nitroreductase